MKITIEEQKPGLEDEIIIRCQEMNEEILRLISGLKAGSQKIAATQGEKIYMIVPKEVYYFEAVDNRVFLYCDKEVYETKSRLYELEKAYGNQDFFRASKSVLLNIRMIRHLETALNGRLEATLKNGEKIIISRRCVPELKNKLGL